MHHQNDSPGRAELFYRTVISMTDEERADASDGSPTTRR